MGTESQTTITAVGMQPVMIGYNYPWAFNKYGLYFGPHVPNPDLPPDKPTVPTDESLLKSEALKTVKSGALEEEMWMEKWLDALPGHLGYLHRKLGVSVVRLFLLCNAINWGGVDEQGSFKPPKYLHLRFRYHFRQTLKAFADAEMQLLPVLIDFGIGDPDSPKSRRLPIVRNEDVRKKFYDDMLEPLLDDSTAFANAIYAWEVMNEPSWLTSHFWPAFKWYSLKQWESGPPDPVVPLKAKTVGPLVSDAELTAFLEDGIRRIENHKLPSTVGHRFFGDMRRYPSGNTPQFHYYPDWYNSDPSELPDAKDAWKQAGLSIPPILGEFGSLKEHGGPWPELQGRDANRADDRVFERLVAIEKKRYSLALVWPDYPEPGDTLDDPLKLSSLAEQGIVRYLSLRGIRP
jgi:hypothetical protein